MPDAREFDQPGLRTSFGHGLGGGGGQQVRLCASQQEGRAPDRVP
jgi:hypothetical protein